MCDVKDCSELTRGVCFSTLTSEQVETVRELRAIRKVYDDMELERGIDVMESPARPYVTWRGWKMIRNVISDRIEEITETRV